MEKKAVSGIMLTLLFIGMLTLAFNIQVAGATGTIYIRADGSVEPPTAPISSVDNVTYTFTADVYDSIVVERDDIVVDGAGYTVQGTGSGIGIDLSYRNNVTLKNVEVTNFNYGIWLNSSSNNNLSGNNASNNERGIYLWWSSNNTLTGNTASNNRAGIELRYSSNNVLANNNASNNRYNFWVWGSDFSDFNNYVDTSNTVDGKPIYYLMGVADAVYDAETNAGTIYLINCNNVTIRDLTPTKNRYGAFFWNTTNSKILNVTASNNGAGITLDSSSNNVLAGNTASNNEVGIYLDSSSNNTLTGNTASNNEVGIFLISSSNNVLTGNIASSNQDYGIWLRRSSNTALFHNNLINNTFQANVTTGYVNTWDNGYPSGGNYWSDYTGVDTNGDGIGDTPYVIDGSNMDRFPLMAPISVFDAGTWNGVNYNVDVVSNSTVSNFQLNATLKTISFNVTGKTGLGFSRVTIPNIIVQDLWQGNYTVLVDGEPPLDIRNWTDTENTYIYFTYQHSEHEVTIVPEFPSATILPILMILTMLAVVFAKRRFPRKIGT